MCISEALKTVNGNTGLTAVGLRLRGDYKLAYILAGTSKLKLSEIPNIKFVWVDLFADETTIIPNNEGYAPYKKVNVNVKKELGLWKSAFRDVILFVKVDPKCFKDFKDKNLEEDFWEAHAF